MSSESTRASDPGADSPSPSTGPRWTFLSNHAHVLISLAEDSDVLMREVAAKTGITERAVAKILVDLEREGLVERHREGRRNSSKLDLDKPLRHPIEQHRTVGELIALIIR